MFVSFVCVCVIIYLCIVKIYFNMVQMQLSGSKKKMNEAKSMQNCSLNFNHFLCSILGDYYLIIMMLVVGFFERTRSTHTRKYSSYFKISYHFSLSTSKVFDNTVQVLFNRCCTYFWNDNEKKRLKQKVLTNGLGTFFV